MSVEQSTCTYCGNTFPNSRTNCPHCAQPQLFPNVAAATVANELEKLEQRFEANRQKCEAENRSNEFTRFRDAASKSHASFACSLEKLNREIASGTDIFETYFQLEELRLQATGFKLWDWAKLRPQAEIEMLGSHHHIDKLHYANLALEWESLPHYGDCVVRLDDRMISHRASCFQGNTAVIYKILANFDDCLRASWHDRGRLAVAVLADRLYSGIADSEFPGLLVAPGHNSVDDEFIEVHIFGTMTVRTFSEVKLPAATSGKQAVYRAAIIEKLVAASVKHCS